MKPIVQIVFSQDLSVSKSLWAIAQTIGACETQKSASWSSVCSDLPSEVFLVIGHINDPVDEEVELVANSISSAKIRNHFPEFVVIANGLTLKHHRRLFEAGAMEILESPINLQRIKYLAESRIISHRSFLSRKTDSKHGMDKVHDQIAKVAPLKTNILLTGETGVGKSFWAEQIHQQSSQSPDHFVHVDCACIPKELVESELFGHSKGAFTGADADTIGQFEYAQNGTIFLDEIDCLSYDVQSKLLRVIEHRNFKVIGTNRTVEMKARVICASNADLPQLVAENKFRADLFYRINTFHILIPPLRQRTSDIKAFVEKFLAEFSDENGKEAIQLDDRVLKQFEEYPWPGNLRELRNSVEYCAIQSRESRITLNDLPSFMTDFFFQRTPEPRSATDLESSCSQPAVVDEYHLSQANRLMKALVKCGFNRTQAAKSLNVSRATVYNMMRRYNIS